MWRKFIVILTAAVTAALLLSAVAQADNSTTPNYQMIAMTGKASVVSTSGSTQLRLKITSQNNTQWLLETDINALSFQRGQDGVSQTVNLGGTFTLGIPGQPLSNGILTGWLDQNSSGEIRLSTSTGSTSLDMTFAVTQDWAVKAQVQGLWPVLSTTPSATTADTHSPSSQSVNHSFWYLSRAAAIIAYLLLFLNLCLGLGLKARPVEKIFGRFQALDLHQFTALLALTFIALHVFTLLGDHYLKFTVARLLLPGNSPYRQLWTTVGIIALYLLLVIILSFYIRKLIGQKTWRVIHYLSFLLFVGILLHSIMAGTDSSALWGKWLYIITGTTTVFLFLWRFLGTRHQLSDEKGPESGVVYRVSKESPPVQ